jgi:hypothetical protein
MTGRIMNFYNTPEEIDYLKRRSSVLGITFSDLCRACLRVGLKAIDENPVLLTEQMTGRVPL